MIGVDQDDPATFASAPHTDVDYQLSLGKSIAGLRIGVPRKGFWDQLTDAQKAAAEATVLAIRDLARPVTNARGLSTRPILDRFRWQFPPPSI